MAEKRSATEASESASSGGTYDSTRRNVRDPRFESSSSGVDADAGGSPAAYTSGDVFASARHSHEPEIPPILDAEGRCLICGLLVQRAELLELLADLAMENKILGLGDAVAEVNDQTGVLGRVRATLGSDFLEGRA